jgi:hypothetical protein
MLWNRKRNLKNLLFVVSRPMEPGPELVNRNQNRNFSKVGTGTVKVVTVTQHWFRIRNIWYGSGYSDP